jgi:hypothetical protein
MKVLVMGVRDTFEVTDYNLFDLVLLTPIVRFIFPPPEKGKSFSVLFSGGTPIWPKSVNWTSERYGNKIEFSSDGKRWLAHV